MAKAIFKQNIPTCFPQGIGPSGGHPLSGCDCTFGPALTVTAGNGSIPSTSFACLYQSSMSGCGSGGNGAYSSASRTVTCPGVALSASYSGNGDLHLDGSFDGTASGTVSGGASGSISISISGTGGLNSSFTGSITGAVTGSVSGSISGVAIGVPGTITMTCVLSSPSGTIMTGTGTVTLTTLTTFSFSGTLTASASPPIGVYAHVNWSSCAIDGIECEIRRTSNDDVLALYRNDKYCAKPNGVSTLGWARLNLVSAECGNCGYRGFGSAWREWPPLVCLNTRTNVAACLGGPLPRQITMTYSGGSNWGTAMNVSDVTNMVGGSTGLLSWVQEVLELFPCTASGTFSYSGPGGTVEVTNMTNIVSGCRGFETNSTGGYLGFLATSLHPACRWLTHPSFPGSRFLRMSCQLGVQLIGDYVIDLPTGHFEGNGFCGVGFFAIHSAEIASNASYCGGSIVLSKESEVLTAGVNSVGFIQATASEAPSQLTLSADTNIWPPL